MNTLLKNSILFFSFWFLYFQVKAAGLVFQLLRKKRRPQKVGSVAYFAAFYPENAGYHYRVKKWAEILEGSGIETRIFTVFTKDEFEKYNRENSLYLYLKPMYKRFRQILSSLAYDTVIVRRELVIFNDYGDLFLDKLLINLHPYAILDFDDDISYAKREPKKVSAFGKSMLESGNKFSDSLKLYRRFICGSRYLKEYLLKVDPEVEDDNVTIIPTCVDYEEEKPKQYGERNKISFGWIGGNYNLKYLDSLIPSLNKLSGKHSFDLKVISGTKYNADSNFEIVNLPWSMDSQLNDLRSIDIGLMPLNYTNEDKGKCGFKLIQYMGLGIVSVASGVTINNEIIEDRENGFLVSENDAWEVVLEEAIKEKEKFPAMGSSARKRIIERFSFSSNKSKYISFVTRCVE